MIVNILGKTNLKVNKLGFGGIPIQRITKEEAKELVIKAVDLGVNFFDTARGYTCSEEYLGNGLVGLREKVYVATKSMARTYQQMKDDIEISLRNLQTDYIDLYQFHNVKSQDEWKKIISVDGALKAIFEAKEKGKIRHIGVTSHSKDFLEWLLDSEYCEIIETIQYPLNFLEEEKLTNVGFFAYSREEGTLAYKFTNQVNANTKKARVKKAYLTQQKVVEYNNNSFVNSVLDVIIDEEEDNYFVGRSYLSAPEVDPVIFIQKNNNNIRKIKIGDIVKIKITQVSGYDLEGELYEFTK